MCCDVGIQDPALHLQVLTGPRGFPIDMKLRGYNQTKTTGPPCPLSGHRVWGTKIGDKECDSRDEPLQVRVLGRDSDTRQR
jgi:hypothetical protein